MQLSTPMTIFKRTPKLHRTILSRIFVDLLRSIIKSHYVSRVQVLSKHFIVLACLESGIKQGSIEANTVKYHIAAQLADRDISNYRVRLR